MPRNDSPSTPTTVDESQVRSKADLAQCKDENEELKRKLAACEAAERQAREAAKEAHIEVPSITKAIVEVMRSEIKTPDEQLEEVEELVLRAVDYGRADAERQAREAAEYEAEQAEKARAHLKRQLDEATARKESLETEVTMLKNVAAAGSADMERDAEAAAAEKAKGGSATVGGVYRVPTGEVKPRAARVGGMFGGGGKRKKRKRTLKNKKRKYTKKRKTLKKIKYTKKRKSKKRKTKRIKKRR